VELAILGRMKQKSQEVQKTQKEKQIERFNRRIQSNAVQEKSPTTYVRILLMTLS